ncbi:MAG TPA: hypothetical protein VH575_25750 [Gemmataceae bacterium]
MGFESFRVELRGGQVNYLDAKETIQKHPHVKLDQQSPPMKGSTFYVVEDGRHVLEIELRDAPVRISCRFTLCHPPSVDAVFLDLVRELMLRLGSEARICDDVRPEDARPFSLANFAEFSSATLGYIAARRREWVAAFGAEQMPATTNEAYERIILSRCQPVTQL